MSTSFKKLRVLSEARKKAADVRRRQGHKLTNARVFAYSVLVEGAHFNQISRLMAWNNIVTPSESTYYRILRVIAPEIERYASISCAKEYQLMPHGTIVAFDGSWSHRRNASHCLTDFMDINRKKVIAFHFTEKSFGSFKGNYVGASNGMEVAGLRYFVEKAKNDPRIVGYCHDRDAKSRAIVRESGWNIPEFLDKNHALKSFDRKFAEINLKSHRLLHGLHKRLRAWMKCLVYLDETVRVKKIDLAKCVFSLYRHS